MTRCLTLPSLEDGLAVPEEGSNGSPLHSLVLHHFHHLHLLLQCHLWSNPLHQLRRGTSTPPSLSRLSCVRSCPTYQRTTISTLLHTLLNNQAEWSSYEEEQSTPSAAMAYHEFLRNVVHAEEQSTPSASMAYRGEIFAFAAAASVQTVCGCPLALHLHCGCQNLCCY